MISVKLNLHDPAELEAFGVFTTALAAARRTQIEDERKFYAENPPLGHIGLAGIDKASNPMWRTKQYEQKPVDPDAMTEVGEKIAETQASAPAGDAPKRERGKPSPGHARRTKEEIAEDKAADEADAALKTAGEETGAVVPDKVIEDSPEDQAQDAADEAAETAANKTGLTLDDVRNASSPYAKKFGVAAASEDIRKALGKPMIDLADDEMAGAVETLKKLFAENPYKRTAVDEDAPTEKKVIGKKDIIDLMLAYALKYDGQNTDTKPEAMPIATEDVLYCFNERFGESVKKLGDLSPDQYEQAYTDVKSLLEKNPFKRVAKVQS